MAWSRADAATWVGSVLGALLTDAGMTSADDAGHAKDPLDEALLLTGTAVGDLAAATVADGNRFGFQRVLRWRVLVRVRDGVANRVDISMSDPNVNKSRNQIIATLDRLITAAEKDAAPYVTATILSSDWPGMAVYSTDYIEPQEDVA